jgi:hypothetical protein
MATRRLRLILWAQVSILTSLISLGGLIGSASAEPYMAIREGRKCSTCHVNMTGGGMRTLLANTHLEDITHYRDIFPEFEALDDLWDGQVTNYFSLGADLRFDDSIIFQDEPNAEGEVDNDQVFRSNVEENILDVRQASVYFLFAPIPDYLEIYLDESFAPGGTTTREIFAQLKGVMPWNGYVKAGKFFVDYGLRTENDDLASQGNLSENLFVRGRTGTGFDGFHPGIEIGFQPGPISTSLSVTNAAGASSAPRVAANTYGIFRDIPVVENALAGGSFMWVPSDNGDTWNWGFYAGSNLGLLEYQAEVDFIHAENETLGQSKSTFVAYGEVNYLLMGWINTKFFGEYADNDGRWDTPDTAQNRFGIGIEPFIGRFLQPRIFYTVANGPRDRPETNQNRLIFELHAFF